MMLPHHAFRHAGGAARIEKKQIAARTLNIQIGAIAVSGKAFIINNAVGQVFSIADFNPLFDLWQARAQLFNIVAKLFAINHNRGIGIVENIMHLIGDIAVIDIHMGQATAKTGNQQLAIFGAVTHIKADLVAGLGAIGQKIARQIIGARAHFIPCNFPVTMHQCQMTLRQNRHNRVNNISEIPLHNVPPRATAIRAPPTFRKKAKSLMAPCQAFFRIISSMVCISAGASHAKSRAWSHRSFCY